MKQEQWEIDEIIESLRNREIVSDASLTLEGCYSDMRPWVDHIPKRLGGKNIEIIRLEMLDEEMLRDYDKSVYVEVETWLIQWENNDVRLLLVKK